MIEAPLEGEDLDEEEPVYGRADSGDIEEAGGRGCDSGVVCRKHGISAQTFYRWKAKYGGLEVSEAQWLRHWRKRTGS